MADWKFKSYDVRMSKALAFIIAGHHAGLPDHEMASSSRACLDARLIEGFDHCEIIQSVLHEDFTNVLSMLKTESISHPSWLKSRSSYSLWVRMLFSCLIDSDRLDTEVFTKSWVTSRRGKYPSLLELKSKFDSFMTNFDSVEQTPINIARAEMLKSCRTAALSERGLFSLAMPTGGGKTLASMAFALDHAASNGMSRIIYAIPYTSIVEQTCEVFRNIFGSRNVIEHHCNIDSESATFENSLASDNWDAPIIVTTNVQLFESLHSARPNRCRKIHNIIDSVIVLDEVQVLPLRLIEPCERIINDLLDGYGVTVVLSTATQPSSAMLPSASIIDDSLVDHEAFKRVTYHVELDARVELTWTEVARKLVQHPKVLCIVDTRRGCLDLYNEMVSLVGRSLTLVHLSRMMCGQHISDTIHSVKNALATGQNVRIISTQLIEAGVDIDLPVVYRAFAGLDSLVQAGGRCNREGKLDVGHVYAFNPVEPSNFDEAVIGRSRTRTALVGATPSEIGSQFMFRNYFTGVRAAADSKGITKLGTEILEDLSCDDPSCEELKFRKAGDSFKMIDDAQMPVIVRYGQGESLIARLREFSGSDEADMDLLRSLQRYAVGLYPDVLERCIHEGLVEMVGTYHVQSESMVYDDTGLLVG